MRRSPLLNRADAVAGPAYGPDGAPDGDALVPAHYGDPLREQVSLIQGRAVSALALDCVVVTGPDRLSWLTTLSSQMLTGLAPGDGGRETLLLDAQGHVVHALAAFDDGAALHLLTQAGRGEALAAFLESMRFMLRVDIAVRQDLVALGAHGPGVDRLAAAAQQAGALVGRWDDPWPGVVEGGTSYDIGLQRAHPGMGYRAGLVVVPEGQAQEVVSRFPDAAGDDGAAAGPAGALAWEALRVEAGRPRWAREVDARTIPHELDWLRTAVHLMKGCYPGQETVARTLNLGRPPRRLTLLQLDGLGGGLPAAGGAVRAGERQVGAVTSVARHYELGPIALALVRRHTPADAVLTVDLTEPAGSDEDGTGGGRTVVGRVAAAQELLVTPEGRAAASPAQRPGAGLRTARLHRRGTDR